MSFFSNKGTFSKIWCHTAQALLTQHFYPRAKQIKTLTVLTVSYNLLYPGSSTSPPNNTSPISGRCAPPHHHGFWAYEPPSTARLLNLTLGVVRFLAPCTPNTQTTLVSRINAKNQHSLVALQEHSDALTIHIFKPGMRDPSETRQPPHHYASAPFQLPLATCMAGNGVFLSTPTSTKLIIDIYISRSMTI